MVLEKEFWRSWDQNEELGQAACCLSPSNLGYGCRMDLRGVCALPQMQPEERVWLDWGYNSRSVPQEGCVYILHRGLKEEANVEIEANEMEQELPEDMPLERVQQDEQSQELAQSGRKQTSNCQEPFQPAR